MAKKKAARRTARGIETLLLIKLAHELYGGRKHYTPLTMVHVLRMPAQIRNMRKYIEAVAKRGPRPMRRGAQHVLDDIDTILY